jgi:hypothetical protein
MQDNGNNDSNQQGGSTSNQNNQGQNSQSQGSSSSQSQQGHIDINRGANPNYASERKSLTEKRSKDSKD